MDGNELAQTLGVFTDINKRKKVSISFWCNYFS